LPSPLTSTSIVNRADAFSTDKIMLHFLTPTRLITEGHLLHAPEPNVLVKRLAERMDALEREYISDNDHIGRWRSVADAAELTLADWDGQWIESKSYSTRQKRALPISGFIGQAMITGELAREMRELLAWGEMVHVGKNVVKGDGWYQVE
jgi:hypothetical protein